MTLFTLFYNTLKITLDYKGVQTICKNSSLGNNYQ